MGRQRFDFDTGGDIKASQTDDRAFTVFIYMVTNKGSICLQVTSFWSKILHRNIFCSEL